MGDTATLRDRLLALRSNVLCELAKADHLDAGLLALAAHASIVLSSLDAEAQVAQSLAADGELPAVAIRAELVDVEPQR